MPGAHLGACVLVGSCVLTPHLRSLVCTCGPTQVAVVDVRSMNGCLCQARIKRRLC